MSFFGFLGGVNAFLAVLAGAFGAHGLRSRLTPEALVVFETGARYHMVHAIALFAIAWAIDRGVAGAAAAGWLLVAGIVLFSGSLYVLSITGVRALGMVTPVGGVCFLIGWAVLAWGFFRHGVTKP